MTKERISNSAAGASDSGPQAISDEAIAVAQGGRGFWDDDGKLEEWDFRRREVVDTGVDTDHSAFRHEHTRPEN